ncbi:hypothetical protein CYMTET_54249 [Cymbomonas tetramitiformis]|uniref:Sulfatase N-terminal domain-containing protein n=1 Tax=Cymbomonas tetramitiformis TaxID=36881 RepID=A0AAE0BH27_9CHLO|nr:hypothetical protein CYMTET_54249 [Cymbomonas tetramitiformis]
MDRLANQGVKLDSLYTDCVCTPSRAQLLTGRHPWRYGLNAGGIDDQDPRALSTDEYLLPEYLKDVGYATYMVPNETDVLNITGCSSIPVDGSDPAFPDSAVADDSDTTDGCVEVGMRTCKTGKEKRRALCATLSYVDNLLGELENWLKLNQQWNNTVIAVHGDNGGNLNDAASNYPYDGQKATLYEGGIRSVGFVVGGYVERSLDAVNTPRGYHYSGLMESTDFFSTYARLAGATSLIESPVDSVDMWSSLINNASSPRKYAVVGFHPDVFNNASAVIRNDGWKLLVNPGTDYLLWRMHTILQRCFTSDLIDPNMELATECVKQKQLDEWNKTIVSDISEYESRMTTMWKAYEDLRLSGDKEILKENQNLAHDLMNFTTYESKLRNDARFFRDYRILLNVNEGSSCINEYDIRCNVYGSTNPNIVKIRKDLERVHREVSAERVSTSFTSLVDPWTPWTRNRTECTHLAFWRNGDLEVADLIDSCFTSTVTD